MLSCFEAVESRGRELRRSWSCGAAGDGGRFGGGSFKHFEHRSVGLLEIQSMAIRKDRAVHKSYAT